MRADAENGYVSELSVYNGKTEGAPVQNLRSKVVMKLYNRNPKKQRVPSLL